MSLDSPPDVSLSLTSQLEPGKNEGSHLTQGRVASLYGARLRE